MSSERGGEKNLKDKNLRERDGYHPAFFKMAGKRGDSQLD